MEVNITIHVWNFEDVEYIVQEFHPIGTTPATEEILRENSLIVKVGHKSIDDIMAILLHDFPQRRFFVVAPKNFILGQTPFIVWTSPKLEKEKLAKVLVKIQALDNTS